MTVGQVNTDNVVEARNPVGWQLRLHLITITMIAKNVMASDPNGAVSRQPWGNIVTGGNLSNRRQTRNYGWLREIHFGIGWRRFTTGCAHLAPTPAPNLAAGVQSQTKS